MFAPSVQSRRANHDDPRMSDHPIFARVYDRLMAGTERAGLAEMRGRNADWDTAMIPGEAATRAPSL